MLLPRDLYTHISENLPPEGKSAFRQASKFMSNLPFNWDECCREPTSYEIATWLYHQSDLIRSGHHAPIFNYREIVPKFLFEDKKEIIMSMMNGDMFGGDTHLGSRDDILKFLGNSRLRLNVAAHDYMNWPMVRDILSRRVSCQQHNISSDTCYIKLLAKHLPKIEEDPAHERLDRTHFKRLYTHLFNYSTLYRLNADYQTFERTAKPYADPLTEWYISIIKGIPLEKKMDPNERLTNRIEKLTPDDLDRDPRIAYENTNYT